MTIIIQQIKVRDNILYRTSYYKINSLVHTASFPVKLLDLLDQIRLRAAIPELGPFIFARNLNLNGTHLTPTFIMRKYCADSKMPFLDLLNIKKVKHCIIKKG